MDKSLSFSSSSNWADTVEAEEAEYGKVAAPLEFGRSPPSSYNPRSPSHAAGPPMGGAMPPAMLPDHPPFKAYIGNVPYDLDEELIEHFFNGLNIRDIHITRHRDTGRAKGCFIEFDSQKDLGDAIALDGTDMMRRPIRIQVAEPRSGPPPRSGGGFFDRGYDSRGPPPRRGGFDDFGDGYSRGGPRGGGGPRSPRSNSSWTNNRNAPPPRRESADDEPPRERPKLVLAPRTQSTETPAAQSAQSPTGKSNPFGAARPTDTAAKLRELEERDRARKAEAASKPQPGSPTKTGNTDQKQPPAPPRDDTRPSTNGDAGARRERKPTPKILQCDGAPSGEGERPGSRGGPAGRGRGGGRADDGMLPHHRQGENGGGSRGRGRGGDKGGRGGRGQAPKTADSKPSSKANPKAVVIDEDDQPKTKVRNAFDILGDVDE